MYSSVGILVLFGIVKKNSILQVDHIKSLRRHDGLPRLEAILHGCEDRLRPILMTTFALIAGMTPVAIGLGEGGEFYRPLAVAIIGGTITSTLLTLLVVPTFYDSIEISHDHMVAKFQRRVERWNGLFAFVLTFAEAILTLLFLRLLYRSVKRLLLWLQSRRGTVAAAT